MTLIAILRSYSNKPLQENDIVCRDLLTMNLADLSDRQKRQLLLLVGCVVACCAFLYDKLGHHEREIINRAVLFSGTHISSTVEGVISSESLVRRDPSSRVLSPSDQRALYRRIQKELQIERSPESLAASAFLNVVQGKLDKSVHLLEEAISKNPTDGSLWNDLAVVYIRRAAKNTNEYDYVLALESADKAIENKFYQAHFNRALTLERLSLGFEARRSWHIYSVLEEASAARKVVSAIHAHQLPVVPSRDLADNLEKMLDSQIYETVSRYPAESRLYVENNLLVAWADLAASSPSKSMQALDKARLVADAIADYNGDSLLFEAIDAIDSARRSILRPLLIASLVDGHRAYGRGLGLFAQGRFSEAESSFELARTKLETGRSPFHAWAVWYIAACRYSNQMYDDSMARVANIIEKTYREDYKSLRGRTSWLAGLIAIAQGEPEQALVLYLDSLENFDAIHEEVNSAAIRGLLAECYVYLGDIPGSWKFRHSALASLKSINNIAREQVILDEAAEASLKDGKPIIARYFQDEVVRRVARRGTPQFRVEAYLRRLPIDYALSDWHAAAVDLKKAEESLAIIRDPPLRSRLRADLLLAEGLGLSTVRPLYSLGRITEALVIYKKINYRFRLTNLYAARAQCYLRLGKREDLALSDLRSGVQEYRRQVRQLRSWTLRKSYAEESLPLLQKFMTSEIARGASDADLFEYAEDFRSAYELVALEEGNAEGGYSLWEKVNDIPPGVRIVSFFVLPDYLMVWSISDGRVTLRVEEISARALWEKVRSFRLLVTKDKAHAKESSELFSLLLGSQPIEEDLIILIPDRFLAALPFSALREGESGPFLVERHSLIRAQSMDGLWKASNRYCQLKSRLFNSVLAIGDPQLDRSQFPALPSLKAARNEVSGIASLFQESRVLSGDKAAIESVAAAAGKYDVIHIASHAVNQNNSVRLVLAGQGKLSPSHMRGFKEGRTRLAVLAACRSAGGEIFEGGAFGLANEFVTNGVPQVVSSLWEIDDQRSKEFFDMFYLELVGRGDAAKALRGAQVEWIRRKRGGSTWAAFELLGGSLSKSCQGNGKER